MVGQRRAIYFVYPLGIIMIGVIVVTVGGIVQEVKQQGIRRRTDAVLYLRNRTQLLHGVVTILRGVHHVGVFGNKGPAHTQLGIDARCHGVTTLGFNEDDTIGTTGAIKSRSILQHRHLVYILRGNGGQHVEDVTQMQRLPVPLHVKLHTIHDNERLGIGIDGADTTNEHGSTLIQVAGMHVHVDVATQFLRHLLVNGNTFSIRYEIVGGRYLSTVFIHRRESSAEHTDLQLLACVASRNGHLL